MRLAVSSIAWDRNEDEAVAELLRHHRIDAIDLVPGKYCPQFGQTELTDILQVRAWWNSRGIEITGMQALLFGTNDLHLFKSAGSQIRLANHLSELAYLAAKLGAKYLTFGSPKNRLKGNLSVSKANQIASACFKVLALRNETYGVTFCLEPNPASYGADFMTTSAETSEVIDSTAHPAVGMQLDTGAITMNGEDIDEVIMRFGHQVKHIHLSEPNLVPLGEGATDHAKIGQKNLRG